MNKTNNSAYFRQGFKPGYASGQLGKFGSAALAGQVFLIGSGNAFADGIVNLLRFQSNLSVRHAIYQDDAAILHEVMQNKPDVLVLILSGAMKLETIVPMLMAISDLVYLRLVVMSLDTPQIRVYEMGTSVHELKSTYITPAKLDDFLLVLDKNWQPLAHHRILY